MRVKEALIGFASALALGGAVAGVILLWKAFHPWAGTSSQIRVVGGSIKFHAKGAWNPPSICGQTPCIVSRSSTLNLTELAVEDSAGSISQLANLSSWIVTINVSNRSGSSASPNGTKVYPSDSGGICATVHNPDPNHVGQFIDTCRVTTTNMNVATAILLSPSLLVPDSYDGGPNNPHKRYRYRDQSNNPNLADYSEMLNTITVNYVIGANVVQTYKPTCQEGDCKVYIGP